MVLSISLYFIFNYYSLKNKHVTKTQHNKKKTKPSKHTVLVFSYTLS